jgi:hypothetical protein
MGVTDDVLNQMGEGIYWVPVLSIHSSSFPVGVVVLLSAVTLGEY